jgi:hypothetical protein
MKPRWKYTVPQAENLVRRATEEIVDPGPRSVEVLGGARLDPDDTAGRLGCEPIAIHDKEHGNLLALVVVATTRIVILEGRCQDLCSSWQD